MAVVTGCWRACNAAAQTKNAVTQLPFWTRGRLGELLACLATPLPKEAKKGGEAALLVVVTLGWLLESLLASSCAQICKIALV